MESNGEKTIEGILETGCAYSAAHELLGIEEAPGRLSLDNIGADGKNLTIAVLSLNRVSLTLRLYRSLLEHIPDFKGELLIGDNGSEKGELDRLYEGLRQSPFKTRIVEFRKNPGVSEGRNRLFSEARTDWILSLDNDAFFTADPLKQIQEDIRALGVHFLALPVIDREEEDGGVCGGSLSVRAEDGRPAVCMESAARVRPELMGKPMNGFLCTGLPGRAAVIGKASFFQAGGYDERLFIGFADIDFSIRLFQKGCKVGSCGMIALEHDHGKPACPADAAYEAVRHSYDALTDDAAYFERKNGFAVWTEDTVRRFDSRCQKLGIPKQTGRMPKPRIALIIDIPDWAFDHIADQLIRHLSDEFDFVRIYTKDVPNTVDILLLAENSDIIHFFWRGCAALFGEAECQKRIRDLGFSRGEFIRRYVDGKVISTTVYDHLLLDGPDSRYTSMLFANDDTILTNYAVCSGKLWEIYRDMPGLKLSPQAICQDGVDLTRFAPRNLQRMKTAKSRTVRLGWSGNSKWNEDDLKGIHSIIRPVVDQLRKEGRDVELIIADYQDRLIPHEEMPSFYARLDCYLCASSHEGTPNPVLEAMACGVPIISTDVGIVPEVLGEKQKDYILRERTVECLKESVRRMIDENAFEMLSRENLISIRSWGWPVMVGKYRNYFRKCLGLTGNTTADKPQKSHPKRADSPISRTFHPDESRCCHLETHEHPETKPPFPVIDMHAHFGPLMLGKDYENSYDTRRVCEVLREMGIEKVLCLELVWGDSYDRLCRKLDASDGMILPVGSVDVFRAMDRDFETTVYRTLRDLKSKGCVALKLWKNMTLMGEDHFGRNLPLDDPHYEPIWHVCGELKLPVIIHVADPPGFFKPVSPDNEAYPWLSAHPEWSHYRSGWFSFGEHMQMQETVIRTHPDTTFVVAHVGSWAENLAQVSEWLARYPNMHVDVAARLNQLGRQPYSARAFIERWQDRVLFGTDFAGIFSPEYTRRFYHTHYRFFQTRDEYFEPPFSDSYVQWRIYGLGLEERVLKKLYRDNASRVFGL